MPTQAQLDLAKKYGYTQDQINQEMATPGSVKRSALPTMPTTTATPYVEKNILSPSVTGITPPVQNTTTPTLPTQPVAQTWDTVGKQKDPTLVSNYLNSQPGFKTTVSGNTVTGTKNGVQTTWVNDGTNWVVKPTIATGDNPVIGTPPATTPVPTTTDFTTMTPEQLKSRYMEIGTKLPGEVTDEDRKFTRYLQTRMSLGETPDVIFGTKGTKSSGTTTYSTELTQPGENIASSERQTDGTYKVTYKDGTTQITTSEPSTTVFPEGTPEYFAQKQAQEANKRLQVLEEQLNTEAERRKKETADLVAKYGENIATQFQTQKAEIEANGAKRMDTLNTGLSFSGFGRSTLALEKRDEIAKNIETTINQAKAKADLELMAYRMEREGADAEAISAMRTNIANVQTKIDDANYANQLEIIKLNQENATTGAEAMNNLLSTISDSEEIVSNADIEKSQMLGYFVNKDGSPMLDSQKRPIQFEGTASGLEPTQIQAYADAIRSGVMKSDELDKRVSPGQKADIMKLVGVRDGTYTPPVSVSDFIAKEEGFRDKAYWDVNGWAVGYGQHAINGKPVVEGQTITKQEADADLANRVANARFNKLITVPLSESQKAALYSLEHNVGGGVWGFASIKPMIDAINARDFNKAADILVNSGVGTRNAATKEVLGGLVARRQREADLLRQSGGGGQVDISNLSKEAQGIIAQINSQGGKPTDYILGTSKDSQALLQEVLQGLNAQGGSGTLASETRTQSLDLAKKTIDELLANKDLAGSFQTRRVGDTGMGAIFNLTANENVNFVNRVDALAGQLMQIDGPTLKAIFGPQISNSDIEMIKKTILQGLDPRNQNPAAFEKTLNDVKAKMQAYINRLPQNQNTGTTPTGQTGGEVVESDWWTVN